MATLEEQKEEILRHWNSKKITVHKRINEDLNTVMNRTLRGFTVEEVKELIDFYATILELGVPEREQKYFWTYKWNLYEFLMRGIKKFDGQDPSNYLKKQTVQATEAVIFKRQ